MTSKICKSSALFLTVLATWFAPGWTSCATAASGTFMAVVNEASSNADSRRSVTFFDGLDIGAGPLFSVFIPFEIRNTSNNAYEDPSAISVDPATGDIYILAFDNTAGVSTSSGVDENLIDAGNPGGGHPEDDDTIGDWDLYRINFGVVYDHWKNNMEGHDLRDPLDPAPNVGGFVPVNTAGMVADAMDDYVTYGVTTPYVDERKIDPFHWDDGDDGIDLVEDGVFDFDNEDNALNPTPSHSNTFVLGDMLTPGSAIEKIGELERNRTSPSNFHKPSLQVIDADTLIMIDDSRSPKGSLQTLANDIDYRLIERVSTSSGDATADGTNGGFNRTTSESWESRRIDQMELDADDASALFSEPQSSAFYDAGTVRGMWVADRDRDDLASNPVPDDPTTGDDIAFLQLDANGNSLGYRAFADFGGATKFDMLNNPAAPDGFVGRVGKVFVDSDTGDLIVVEEGFTDSTMNPVPGAGLMEPATVRVPVNYDNAGQIDLGAWGTKHVLGANGGIAKDTPDTFKERGYWSAYDSENDLVYFMSPGDADAMDPLKHFAADIYVMDVNTGLTTSYLNVDGSVSLFFSNSNTNNGDTMVAFTLADDPGGLAGDYNGNDIIDAADYTVWRDALTAGSSVLLNDSTPGVVDESDFTYWRNNFGNIMGSGAGNGSVAIPEPGSLALLVIGLAGLWAGRRRGQ